MAKKKGGRGFSDCWLAEKRRCIFRQGVLQKMYGHEAAKKRRLRRGNWKLRCQWFLSKEVILKHPCVPCAGLTRVVIRDDPENRGRSWGGGEGRYEARMVKGEFCVITCNLTASAPHLLVSAVPRIWIAMSKGPFLKGLEKYMYCHTISPGSYISWHKGAAHPLPPPTVFSLHPPPPHVSSLCVILCIISLWPHFLVSPIPFSFQFSQRGCGFLAATLQIQFAKRLLRIPCEDNAELFLIHFLRRLASLHWFSCLVFADKSKIV